MSQFEFLAARRPMRIMSYSGRGDGRQAIRKKNWREYSTEITGPCDALRARCTVYVRSRLSDEPHGLAVLFGLGPTHLRRICTSASPSCRNVVYSFCENIQKREPSTQNAMVSVTHPVRSLLSSLAGSPLGVWWVFQLVRRPSALATRSPAQSQTETTFGARCTGFAA